MPEIEPCFQSFLRFFFQLPYIFGFSPATLDVISPSGWLSSSPTGFRMLPASLSQRFLPHRGYMDTRGFQLARLTETRFFHRPGHRPPLLLPASFATPQSSLFLQSLSSGSLSSQACRGSFQLAADAIFSVSHSLPLSPFIFTGIAFRRERVSSYFSFSSSFF